MSRFHKYRLLLDEGFPLKTFFPRLNSTHLIAHITKDQKKSGLTDPEVFEEARKQKRILITFNYKDFKEMAGKSKETGVIGISSNLSLEQIDKKLNALLAKSKPGKLYGKFIYISGETK